MEGDKGCVSGQGTGGGVCGVSEKREGKGRGEEGKVLITGKR